MPQRVVEFPIATHRAGRRLWTAADDALMREVYPHVPTADLAARLGRSVCAVYGRAELLGLNKSAAFLASEASGRLRLGSHPNSVAHRFQPGLVPANKGLRRPGWSSGRMAATQFRKGQKPHTWKPVGTEVLDDEGYRKRKTADDRTRPSRFNWRYVHVLVWEEAHGPVPAGHALVFKNGDRTDIRLDNLECLSRRALMARNTVQNLPQPLKQTVQLLGALTRQIRRRSHAPQEQDR